MTLNTSALEKLVHDPQGVLAHEDDFWQQERAQVLTLKWGEAVGYPISREQWRKQVAAWAELPLHERETHPLVRNCRRIVERKDDFLARAIPHLCSYLPAEATLNVTVQLTAFIPPRAFAIEDIVINVAATYWKDNVDNILSCLIHELGHAGHSWCRNRGGDDGLADDNLCTLLYGLQGEGFCDYVAYQARHEFPAPDELDFRLYGDPAEVRRQMGIFNEVLASATGAVPADELSRLIWDKCIQGRAYYIAGMHCCHTIIEKCGRAALTETLVKGPLSFVELYNSVADAGMWIKLPNLSAPAMA